MMTDIQDIIDINQIQGLIPHRYPFLLIDRIVDLQLGKSAVGIKNVSFNEPHFQGHFPNFPIMPGVLIVEAMAQTSGALVVKTLGAKAEGKIVFFMSIEDAKFRKPVVPGDTMYIHVDVIKGRGAIWKFKGIAKVDDKIHAEATFTAMIMNSDGSKPDL
jgi:3-hydroxyacyl-[acyl-carrier-protein] dehydratase